MLGHYAPVKSFYKLAKTVEEDPEFDRKKAQKKLRRFVEGHDHAIRLKAEIMVDHFHDQVLAQGKIGGAARAMVVTNGIERAIQYFHAVREYLKERKSRYRAIVAFSGDHEFGGAKLNEATLNGFPSKDIAGKLQTDPYRFLVCADKFQTGYDEPLLHTMYVDKTLSGIQAVQTLSRLNRAHQKKHDVFVLDFLNDADTIQGRLRRLPTVRRSSPTRPTRTSSTTCRPTSTPHRSTRPTRSTNSRGATSAGPSVTASTPPSTPVWRFTRATWTRTDRWRSRARPRRSCARTRSCRPCCPTATTPWEKRSIFLEFLIPKLPAPEEEDLSKGILDAIDMDSYRVEKQAMQEIALADADAEIDPVPTSGVGGRSEADLDRLSNIIMTFNDLFGDIAWEDRDRVSELITETIPARVAVDSAFSNARRNSDVANARIEHDRALARVMTSLMRDDTELFKQFMDNESFKRWMTDTVFTLACEQAEAPESATATGS